MLALLIDVYRAWPFRTHCQASDGSHAWPCRLAGIIMTGEPQVPDCKHRK